MRVAVLVFASVVLPGCVGTLNSVLDRPITSDHLDEPKEPNKLKTVNGPRRLVRTHESASSRNYEICAETQADAIIARSSVGGLNLTGKGDFDDEVKDALTKTVERGQVSDVVRHLHWHTCNARLNGWIDDAKFFGEMQEIRKAAFEAMTRPADQQKPSAKPTPTASPTATPSVGAGS